MFLRACVHVRNLTEIERAFTHGDTKKSENTTSTAIPASCEQVYSKVPSEQHDVDSRNKRKRVADAVVKVLSPYYTKKKVASKVCRRS